MFSYPVKIDNNRKKPLWMTGKVLRGIKEKHKLWKKWRLNKQESAYLTYKKQGNKASKAVRLAKRDFEKQIAAKIKRDSKSFYKKYVNSKSKVRSTVGPLIDGKGVLMNDDKKMGDRLNSYFASVCTDETQNICLRSNKQSGHSSGKPGKVRGD